MYSISGTSIKVYNKTQDGLAVFGTIEAGTPPTTASTFAVGCRIIDLSANTLYVNKGTTATPSWSKYGSAQGVAQVTSNGTTAVSVWAGGAPTALTIKGVWLISLDTTATNITVENPASTVVCTIAKGTTAGALVGAVSLANTSVAAGTDVVVDGSGAGNASVFIAYEIA